MIEIWFLSSMMSGWEWRWWNSELFSQWAENNVHWLEQSVSVVCQNCHFPRLFLVFPNIFLTAHNYFAKTHLVWSVDISQEPLLSPVIKLLILWKLLKHEYYCWHGGVWTGKIRIWWSATVRLSDLRFVSESNNFSWFTLLVVQWCSGDTPTFSIFAPILQLRY